MPSVESFELDHDAVEAPYVRHCGTHQGIINKYDIRFTQPNEEFMKPEEIHTLEHLLAYGVRSEVEKLKYDIEIIDISPMGCQTGFYLIVYGNPSIEQVIDVIVAALKTVVKATEIPANTRKECGQYTLHSLKNAKARAEKFLASSTEELKTISKK